MLGASRWLELKPKVAAIPAAAVTAAITASFLIEVDGFLIWVLPKESEWLGSRRRLPIQACVAVCPDDPPNGPGPNLDQSTVLVKNPPPMAIRAVISDFGGVLTTPLLGSFLAFQDETGISAEALGHAMQRIAERDGEHPLFELERGRLTESEFLDLLRSELTPELGHEPELHRFSEIYFEALDPNQPMIELMRNLKARGYRMALLTNNVREWEPLWRAMLPVDEIFELVVDSGFVGIRKPEPEIYELTVERIGGGIGAQECLFVDDLEDNVAAARQLGMTAIQFRSTDQAIAEIRAALDAAG